MIEQSANCKFRILTHFDVDTFVEEVLVKDGEWLPGNPEALTGWYGYVTPDDVPQLLEQHVAKGEIVDCF
ncbi:hypothetical protein KY289_020267 [Solanum tuberosum]|nr:hypothetical protein KY289_020267 [Solanum tuberosum]